MGVVTYVLDDRVWTRAERDALPDDGSRYELVDGVLVVTPSPRVPHQAAVGGLHLALASACPAELRVFVAPLDVTVSDDTVLQPDLLVVTREQAEGETLHGVPLLAVEVLSASTRLVDLDLKRPRLARAGCSSFWVLDPATPSLTAWDLNTAGGYVEVAHVVGDEQWTATRPFAVTLSPAALVR